MARGNQLKLSPPMMLFVLSWVGCSGRTFYLERSECWIWLNI